MMELDRSVKTLKFQSCTLQNMDMVLSDKENLETLVLDEIKNRMAGDLLTCLKCRNLVISETSIESDEEKFGKTADRLKRLYMLNVKRDGDILPDNLEFIYDDRDTNEFSLAETLKSNKCKHLVIGGISGNYFTIDAHIGNFSLLTGSQDDLEDLSTRFKVIEQVTHIFKRRVIE